MGSYANWTFQLQPIGGAGSGIDLTPWLVDLDVAELLSDVGEATWTLDIPAECCDVLAGYDAGWSEYVLYIDGVEGARGMVWSRPYGSGKQQWSGRSLLQWFGLRYPHVTLTSAGSVVTWAVDVLRDALTPASVGLAVIEHSGSTTGDRSTSPTADVTSWGALSADLGNTVDVVAIGREIHVLPAGDCIGWMSPAGVLNSAMFEQSGDENATPLSVERRMDRWATTVRVLGATDPTPIAGTSGSPVTAPGGDLLAIERTVSNDKVTTVADAATAAAVLVPTYPQRAPLTLVADAESAWLACDSGVPAQGLRPGACVTLEASGCGEVVAEQARIRAVRWRWSSGDKDHAIRAGVVVAQNARVWE